MQAYQARAAALATFVERELAHARSYAARATQDTEDGKHILERIYEAGTNMRYYAAQARDLRESYERYTRHECPKAS